MMDILPILLVTDGSSGSLSLTDTLANGTKLFSWGWELIVSQPVMAAIVVTSMAGSVAFKLIRGAKRAAK